MAGPKESPCRVFHRPEHITGLSQYFLFADSSATHLCLAARKVAYWVAVELGKNFADHAIPTRKVA